ncbi:MAG TPA: hypothetical protein VJ717_17545 [Gemmatimonadaceae bacterium]|nr:hypothetical protein [Gemmatimonadaceae bacterium]
MIGRDLFLNLMSEGIGILVTVFLVDQILLARQRQKWHAVREIFLMQLEVACDMLWVGLDTWLGRLMHEWELPGEQKAGSWNPAPGWRHISGPETRRQKGREAYRYLMQFDRVRSTTRNLDRATERLVRSELDAFRTSMERHFFPRPLAAHDSWPAFRDTALSASRKLEDLIGKYAQLTDHKLVLPIIRAVRDIEWLIHYEQFWEGRGFPGATHDDHNDRFDLLMAGFVTSLVEQLIHLRRYIRNDRATRSDAWRPLKPGF